MQVTEFGELGGYPALYCHGFPGSRLEPAIVEQAARAAGVRIIAPDRPGFGRSEHQPNRTILDWRHDAKAIADHLALEQFSVLGVSAGAAYALACAYALGTRVRRVALVAPLAPPEIFTRTASTSLTVACLRGAAKHPNAAVLVAHLLGVLARNAMPLLLALMIAKAPPCDQRTLRAPRFRAALACSTREAFAAGSNGAAIDLQRLCAPWGFDLEAIQTPVDVWHGRADRVVPSEMAASLKTVLAHANVHCCPDLGHYSLVEDRAADILRELVT